jgi:PAS domain S-box-containing protein
MRPQDTFHGTKDDKSTRPLSELCGVAMDLDRFLHLSIGTVGAVADLHRQNIIHGDIQPRNILVDLTTGDVTITVSSIASDVPYECPDIQAIPRVEGTFAYLSPEQTGRMNRVIDYRTDLYSLGVTFYEMLTGRLPFQAKDVLEWVHCHIARVPSAPVDVDASIPRVLSDILMKLLAKSADERYQTALGLKYDLEKCLGQWESKRSIDPFALGEWDISDRLLIPQKLYGREKDINVLLSAFERVVQQGIPELVMIAGYSGIGKTSLVRELFMPIVREQGLFISGKFDQYKRYIPYATIAEAFRGLIQQILTESEERITGWRDQLLSALGGKGQLIVDVIPQLELIIGKQPAIPELPPAEAQNRFNMVFRQFLGVFARKEHPLVVFLDDLQWVDGAGLKLLDHIMTYPDTRHLLFIGAYRDNEVDESHPLRLMLEDIRRSRAISQTITLSPLSYDDVSHLIADSYHADRQRVGPLAGLVYEKTAGNPFFVIQFLKTLYCESLVYFDRLERQWKWNISGIQAMGYSDNVVELMLGKLKKLSEGVQQELRLSACIGNRFDLNTLSWISKVSYEETRQALWEAVQEGVVLPLGEGSYRFLHDRVQQAAYSLIPEEQRPAVHLEIGRLLLAHSPGEKVEEKIFDLMNHLNLGAALISDQEEKIRTAELDLLAGRKAKASAGYGAAVAYFSAGMALLDEESWDTRYKLTHDLYLCRAECEYLNGGFKEAEQLLSAVLAHAVSKTDKAAATCVMVQLFMTQGRSDKAVEAAVECLRQFGIEMTARPGWDAVQREYEKVWKNLGGRSIEDLVDLPDMTDPDTKAAMEILSVTITPAIYTDKDLHCLVLCHMVNLSLLFGIAEASASGFVWFGVVLGGPTFCEHQLAFRFGKLAYDLVEKRNMVGQKGRVFVTFASLINPWTQHIRTGIGILRLGFESAVQAGDLPFACYGCQHLIVQMVTKGDPLGDVYLESQKRLDFVQKAKFGLSECVIISQQRFIQNLRGLTNHFSTFNDTQFKQDEFEAYLARNEANLASAAFRYYIRKLQARFMSGDYEEALEAMTKARELLWTSPSFLEIPEYYYYGALVLAALYGQASPERKKEYLETLASHRQQLEQSSVTCPENFLNKYALVCAEIARIDGRVLEAEEQYERAILSARGNGFIQNQGISYELAGGFYRERGFHLFADTCVREARGCYLRWGAEGKVRQLDQKFPWLTEEESVVAGKGPLAQISHLDAFSVIKASQAISGEIVFSNLLETLLRTALENAGAQKGCLILTHGEDLSIGAEARVNGKEIEVFQPEPFELASVFPVSIVNYVRRTWESVILDDASAPNMFSADRYIQENKPISVLCLPLLRQANLIGVLFLENRLAKGAFTAGRIAVLELLAAQAAISLENAALYRERSLAEDALRQSEEKYRAIFENSGSALIFIEEDMTISICNKEFEKLSGYARVEVEGRKKWTGFVARQSDLERMKEYHRLRRLNSDAVPQTYEFQFLDRMGSKKDVVVTVAAIPETNQSLAVLLDITERKRTEEERARLATVIEQTAEGIIVTDTRWIIQYANPALKRISGYETGEIVGRHARVLMSDRYDRVSYRTIQDSLNRGEAWSGQVISRRKDGSFYEAEVAVSPVRDESGAIINHVSIHRDITHEVRLEKELRQAQKMEAIGRLAGGIAHDFNNILMGIMGYTEMALSRVQGNDLIRRYLQRILDGSSRASELVKQILTFSRKSDQERKLVHIAPTINEGLKLLRSTLPSTIEIQQDIAIAPEDGVILADPTQIHQVLMNLCTNAAHAMRASGGVLGVKLSTILADAQFVSGHPDMSEGQYVCLSVSDTGHGMDAGVMERIFDPYFTTKGVGEGSGMGLALVQGIVQSCGGTICVSSKPGRGTLFEVYFPRIEQKVPQEGGVVEALASGSERILFVDDEEALTDLGKEILESLGYRVNAVMSSLEALDIFRARPDAFDLIITDMTMPNLTGNELAAELMAVRPDIPIILCTGFSEIIDEKQAKDAGIREFVMKPYVITSLAKMIRKVLDQE